MDKYLNVIALNIPYPANYGGVIDIYYKLKALHECGVHIILHCFEYERQHAPELLDICEEVHYYKRNTGLMANLSFLPYNVYIAAKAHVCSTHCYKTITPFCLRDCIHAIT